MSEDAGERIAVLETKVDALETKVDALTDSLKEHREETKKTARSLNEFISCVKQERAERKGRDRALVVVGGAFGSGITFAISHAKAIMGALGVVVR